MDDILSPDEIPLLVEAVVDVDSAIRIRFAKNEADAVVDSVPICDVHRGVERTPGFGVRGAGLAAVVGRSKGSWCVCLAFFRIASRPTAEVAGVRWGLIQVITMRSAPSVASVIVVKSFVRTAPVMRCSPRLLEVLPDPRRSASIPSQCDQVGVTEHPRDGRPSRRGRMLRERITYSMRWTSWPSRRAISPTVSSDSGWFIAMFLSIGHARGCEYHVSANRPSISLRGEFCDLHRGTM